MLFKHKILHKSCTSPTGNRTPASRVTGGDPHNNFYHTFDSSVGRAVDCSCELSEIHRSLVQIRLEGVLLFEQILSVGPMCPGSSVGRALGF